MNNRAKKILFDYRAFSRDIWSKEEQEEGRQAYNQQRGGKTKCREDNLGDELDPILQAKQLNSAEERSVLAQATFTSQILNSLDRVTPDIDCDGDAHNDASQKETSSTSRSPPQYPILTPPFDADVTSSSLEKLDTTPSQVDSTESNSHFRTSSNDSETIREKLAHLLDGQEISEDKELPLRIMYDHFQNVADGTAEAKPKPFLVVTGAPGTGKSWFIDLLVKMAKEMQLELPIRSSWMGIAAINIGGETLCSQWQMPFEGLPSKIEPWSVDRLEAFKRKYDVENISVIIVDEVSMMKPWMLTYLDQRLRVATQCDEMFGGKAVILLGDFDQQPPIGGSSLPKLSMEYLRKDCDTRNKKYRRFISSKKERAEMRCTLSRRGVELFQRALLVKLHVQHRFAQDQKHIELLEKMRSGSPITPSDLSLYQTLGPEDMTPDNFLFATTIVSNNHERHEINAHQAQLWAKHFRTHIVRWKRHIKSWKGKPSTERQVEEAEKETCFWEYFVPMAPGYLTYNLNTERDLANGAEIRLHSLSFETEEEADFLHQMQETTEFGGVIDLPNPPKAINVELYPDSELDSESKKKEHQEKRKRWRCGSITDDGRTVIPIDNSHSGKIRVLKESVRGRSGSVRFRPCKALLRDHFPIELGFCVTVEKAQVNNATRLLFRK